MGYDFFWRSQRTLSVSERRALAERELAKLVKKNSRGAAPVPVRIEGRAIATSFWGKAWCANLEHYSDFENRLPRGRSYVRNGSVIDLQIAAGVITAHVAGSRLYRIRIAITPANAQRWKLICRDCAGTIASLVELLQGRLDKSVMERVTRPVDGLFPTPAELNMSCSCPDWAAMCKHVAAVLYGVGARLDRQPQLLFTLRGVNENELIARAGKNLSPPSTIVTPTKVLDSGDVAAIFGLEMAEPANPVPTVPPSAESKRPGRSRASIRTKKQARKPRAKPSRSKATRRLAGKRRRAPR